MLEKCLVQELLKFILYPFYIFFYLLLHHKTFSQIYFINMLYKYNINNKK